MRYRRFGTSALEVSEVGFGVWTLASDWWGVVDDKAGMLRAALDAGINFIDTAPVYGVGRRSARPCWPTSCVVTATRSSLTTKCGYDIEAARRFPGQSERPQDWRPESVREQLEASLRRLGTDHIDLYQLHNARIDPILDDELWAELERLREQRARSASSASRSAPRSAGSRKVSARCATVRSCRCRPCSTCSSRSPG